MSSRLFPVRSGIVVLTAALVLAGTAIAQDQPEKQNGGAPAEGGGAPQGPPPALVRVAEVQKQTVQNKLDVVGRLQEVRRAVVAAEQEGRITEMAIEEGTPVDAGKTVLAKIDDTWMKLSIETANAKLAQAGADVKEAQARAEQSERQHKSLQELAPTGAARQKEVEDARNIAEADRAKLEAAKAAVSSAQAELRRAREYESRIGIKAPFDGVVIKKLTEVGQWVTPGSAVAEIISRGEVDAVVDVPERLINHVAVGNEVEVRIEPLNRAVTGKVIAIKPMAATAARTFPVKVRMDDEGGRLKPGMSVLAAMPTGEKVEALTVPRDAVLHSPEGASVWANANGAAAKVPVRVLFGHGDRYVVEPQVPGVLNPGARVVVEGGERVMFPGQPLQVAPDPQSAAK